MQAHGRTRSGASVALFSDYIVLALILKSCSTYSLLFLEGLFFSSFNSENTCSRFEFLFFFWGGAYTYFIFSVYAEQIFHSVHKNVYFSLQVSR